MKTALFVLAGAGIGAAIGQSQILCADGQCMITGSWMGGSVIGGLLGVATAGLLPFWVVKEQAKDETDADESATD